MNAVSMCGSFDIILGGFFARFGSLRAHGAYYDDVLVLIFGGVERDGGTEGRWHGGDVGEGVMRC